MIIALHLLCLWVAVVVPRALSLSERLRQHPKMYVSQNDDARMMPNNSDDQNEYIVILQQSAHKSALKHSKNSTVAPLMLRQRKNTQIQRVPSNWFLVALTEEELADVLDDDEVAFVEQVRTF